MRRSKGHLSGRRLVSLLLVLVFCVSCLSFESFAGQEDPVPAYRFEDGTQAIIEAVQNAGGHLPAEVSGDYASRRKNALPETPLTTRMLEVYSTYFFFNGLYAGSMATLNGMYLGYSSDGGNSWNAYPGLINYWSSVTVSGLTPDTDYIVRLITSRGAFINDYKIHTGKAETPVKSVKVQAVRLKKHRVRNRTPYLGLLLSGYHTEYTYKIKVTVTMRKKPGTPGIFINGVWVGGNKRKYSKTFPTLYRTLTSPRGKGYTVSVYSAVDTSGTYCGYSPLWQKTKRVR